jgi:adhesin/invasin
VSPVAGITLVAGATALLADGASSTTIAAALITPSGGPAVAGTAVTFATDLGRFNVSGAKTVIATTSDDSGKVVVPFISEAGVAGTATIIATAQEIIQKVTIELIAVAPPTVTSKVAGIVLQTGSTSLVANGTSSTLITATLVTSTGDLAGDGITVNFTTDLGRFSTDGAKTATATTDGGTGSVLIQFGSEKDVVGTATIVANVGGVAQSIQIALTGAGAPATIILGADSTTISIFGTTGITAQVLDDEGNPVADGTAVFFSASLVGTGVTPSDTTVEGLATAIFSAGTQSGVATVVATSGAVSATVSITIASGPAGSLEFVSAVPTVIGVKGSALPQKSTITFRVRDVNGNPVTDGTLVTFTLISGVGGTETLEPVQVGTTAGLASTVLTSGTVSGPVRVQARVTVGSITLTSTSTNVSIAGGAPSGAHLGIAPAFRNIAGLVTQGIICPATAIVGDRFGNPVPQNTAVSFFTNGGVIAPQGLTDEIGNALSEIKTGPPTPHVGTVTNFSDPRTGVVTIIAVTQGEETFIDSNGNGLFDGPQEFNPNDPELDTPEPFIDHVILCNGLPFPAPCPANPVNPPILSGNNQFDSTDRFELFIDSNGNGAWDQPNDVWDANKPIFATTTVLFTGPTQLSVGVLQADGSCFGNPSGFNVPDGGSSAAFCFLASDPAGRPLVGGTQIRVTTSAGAISGTASLDLPDTQRGGPGITFFTFAVVDDDPGDTDPPSDALVTVSVTSPNSATCPGGNGNLAVSFAGTVN